jgi:hypothetical protein
VWGVEWEVGGGRRRRREAGVRKAEVLKYLLMLPQPQITHVLKGWAIPFFPQLYLMEFSVV